MNIEEYLSKNKIEAEVIHCEKEVKTVADCAELGIEASKIAKSILLIVGEEKKLLCVLLGSDKIDFKKIRTLTGINNIRTANPEEVLSTTGFEVGGVIPTIPGVDTIIDERVVSEDEVYSGGGDSSTLLKLKVSEIEKFGRVENIHKEEDLNPQDRKIDRKVKNTNTNSQKSNFREPKIQKAPQKTQTLQAKLTELARDG